MWKSWSVSVLPSITSSSHREIRRFVFQGDQHRPLVTWSLTACFVVRASSSGWNSLDALSTESFPTASRTTGTHGLQEHGMQKTLSLGLELVWH